MAIRTVARGQITLLFVGENVTSFLTNPYDMVDTDIDGENGDYSDAITSMKVFIDGVDDTDNWTFEIIPGPGVTGFTNGNIYTVTNTTIDKAEVVFKASKEGYETITQTFYVIKNKQGVQASGTKYIKLKASKVVIKQSDLNSAEKQIEFTTESKNLDPDASYEWYKSIDNGAYSLISGQTSSSFTVNIANDLNSNSKVKYRVNRDGVGDVVTITKLSTPASGTNYYVVTDNESEIIPADHTGMTGSFKMPITINLYANTEKVNLYIPQDEIEFYQILKDVIIVNNCTTDVTLIAKNFVNNSVEYGHIDIPVYRYSGDPANPKGNEDKKDVVRFTLVKSKPPVLSIDNEYCIHYSSTVAPSNDSTVKWYSTRPVLTGDYYVWVRTVTTYKNGAIEYGYPKLFGSESYTWTMYASDTNGANISNNPDDVIPGPSGNKYIGHAYGMDVPQDDPSVKDLHKNPNLYIWSVFNPLAETVLSIETPRDTYFPFNKNGSWSYSSTGFDSTEGEVPAIIQDIANNKKVIYENPGIYIGDSCAFGYNKTLSNFTIIARTKEIRTKSSSNTRIWLSLKSGTNYYDLRSVKSDQDNHVFYFNSTTLSTNTGDDFVFTEADNLSFVIIGKITGFGDPIKITVLVFKNNKLIIEHSDLQISSSSIDAIFLGGSNTPSSDSSFAVFKDLYITPLLVEKTLIEQVINLEFNVNETSAPQWANSLKNKVTSISDNDITTPRLFAGKTEIDSNGKGRLTGIAIGKNILGDNNKTIGIVAYNNNYEYFRLDTNGYLSIGNKSKYPNGVLEVDESGRLTLPQITVREVVSDYSKTLKVIDSTIMQDDKYCITVTPVEVSGNAVAYYSSQEAEKILNNIDHTIGYLVMDIDGINNKYFIESKDAIENYTYDNLETKKIKLYLSLSSANFSFDFTNKIIEYQHNVALADINPADGRTYILGNHIMTGTIRGDMINTRKFKSFSDTVNTELESAAAAGNTFIYVKDGSKIIANHYIKVKQNGMTDIYDKYVVLNVTYESEQDRYRIDLFEPLAMAYDADNSVIQESIDTFEIDEKGLVTMRGSIQSIDYEKDSSGWRISSLEGLEINDGTFRGRILIGPTNSEVAGMVLSNQDIDTIIWAGDSYENRNNAPFRVLKDGTVYASKGVFSGKMITIGNIEIVDETDLNNDASISIYDSSDPKTKVIELHEDRSVFKNKVTFTNDSNQEFKIDFTDSDFPVFALSNSSFVFNKDSSQLIEIAPYETSEDHKTLMSINSNEFLLRLKDDAFNFISNANSDSYDFNFSRLDTSEKVKVNIDGDLNVKSQVRIGNMIIVKREDGNGIDFFYSGGG